MTTKPCSVIDPLNPCGEWVGFTARGACGRCRHPKRCHPKKPRPIKERGN